MSGLLSIPSVPEFPPMLVVSVTNACDYACVQCFHRIYRRQPGYARQDMPRKAFDKIVAELGEHPRAILRLIAWGEPLLHPRFVNLVEDARRNAPANPITLITNGYHLTPDRSLALMHAGLDLVEVSVDAVSEATYRRVRIAPDREAYAVVTGNVKEMVRLRTVGGFGTRIAVSYIVWPTEQSEAECDVFQEQWREIADEVVRRRLHTFKGSVATVAELPAERRPCRGLWARCNINPWGQINVCYNDWENAHILGDLRDSNTTIRSVWQGVVLDRLRRAQCQGVFEGICAQCRDYNPDAWEHPYEEVVKRCSLGQLLVGHPSPPSRQ